MLETVLLNEVEFVLCIDGIGQDGLNFHVSKQPKEGQLRAYFVRKMRSLTFKWGLSLRTDV